MIVVAALALALLRAIQTIKVGAGSRAKRLPPERLFQRAFSARARRHEAAGLSATYYPAGPCGASGRRSRSSVGKAAHSLRNRRYCPVSERLRTTPPVLGCKHEGTSPPQLGGRWGRRASVRPASVSRFRSGAPHGAPVLRL